MIDVRTLGAFRIIIDGIDCTPSASKPRTVLAMLAFHYNRLVTVDALIDELWGAKPPRTAMTTLQTYIWQLRKAFTDAHQHLIETRPGGYTLRVPAESMDIWMFDKLTAEGRKAAADGELHQAATLLDQALAYWRGAVISDITTGERLDALKVYWHETRLATWQLKMEVALRLGRHHEVLGELKEMTATYPLDEKASRMLMLALYRCGRQGEALASYQRIRQNLIRDLGIEPSPALRELHHKMLDADPGLAFTPESEEAATAPAAPPLTKPAQLPPDISGFAGRCDLLRSLREALVPVADAAWVPVVSIIGPAGVGKSALAIRLAHQVKDRFPDGQIYVDLRGNADDPLDANQALSCMLYALGIDPGSVPGSVDIRASLFRSYSSDRKLLVVLDNAASARQVRPLLPNGPHCGVLITGRSIPYGLPNSYVANVEPLDEDQSMSVLTATVPARRLMRERAAAEAIIRECRGLPRMLHAVAIFAACNPDFLLSETLSMLKGIAT